MEQYIEIKAANPDCLLFYRMGDFYEMFFEDAEVASRALGIVLTKRGKHHGRGHPDVRRAGRPRRRISAPADRARPSRRGLRAARRSGRGEEARRRKAWCGATSCGWSRPGTLTEDTLLDARRNNYLLAIARARLSSAGEESALRARLDRHFDRRVPHRRMRRAAALAAEIAAAGAGRDHRLRRALLRCGARRLMWRDAAGGDAARRATCSTARPPSGG